ncbi:hypothetical protein FRC06_003764 [Ceratobasidium sp. 370]|nr:hypothetical protein FRC06_003764 [Ceratobasidium sp. 370]
MPECRAAEQAKIRARRRSQEARRQTGALDGLPIEGAVRVSGQPEPVGHAPEPTVEHAPEPAAENTPEPVERCPKSHKVMMETVPDKDAPVTIEPPMTTASGSSMPFVGEASRTHADPVVDTSSMHIGPELEPPRPSSGAQNRAGRHARGGLRRWKGLYVEDFPDPLAGAPISEDRAPEPDLDAYMRSCGTLADPWNFEAAELLTTSGMTDTAKDRHLKSRLCNIIQAVRDLFANQSFKEHFHAAPERHWLSPRKDQRVYSEIHTANWWWREQEKMQGKGPATIAPLIISSDVTTLLIMCGGQKAYPVYASVGNIDKSVRRQQLQGAMVLLRLLPMDAFEDVQNDHERRCLKADLVHRAVEKMLEPLKQASKEGIDMWCLDGRLHRVYPRIAAYMADWPEQNLHSCTSEGSCLVCSTQWGDRGNNERLAPLRDCEETLNTIRAYFAYRDVGELRELNLRPVWPWWGDLPHVNLASCFTPDLLHQLYQGVFKSHLVRWMKHLVGADKLDERFAAMPDAEGMRHFTKGITSVQQWTGHESKEMVSQILPIVVGKLTPEECRLVRSVIDFVFQAHASSMTDKDLEELERDLSLFHELKGLLVVKGFYQSEKRFNRIPKIHMLSHYAHSIRELGTPDGYNTETSERLHIEYAKVPWRASNKVRPLLQMLKYIQHQQVIRIHRAYLDRYLGIERDKDGEEDEETVEIGDGTEEHVGREAIGSAETGIDVAYPDGEGVEGEVSRDGADLGVGEIAYPNPWRHMAANPTKRNVLIKDVIGKYGAADLTSAITQFMTKRLGVPAHDVLLSPYNRLNIWHHLYLHHRPLPFAPLDLPR